MSLKTFISKIGNFFTNLFSNAAKVWKKLSPELQASMLHGSAIIAAVNDNIDKAPTFVIEILQKKFPDLSVEKIKLALKAAAQGLSIAEGVNSDDLESSIKNLQVYLSGLKGATWAKISHTLSAGIAIALAPAGTKLAAIVSLLEYVYQDLIKGK